MLGVVCLFSLCCVLCECVGLLYPPRPMLGLFVYSRVFGSELAHLIFSVLPGNELCLCCKDREIRRTSLEIRISQMLFL